MFELSTDNDIIESSPAQMISSTKNYEMAGMALPPNAPAQQSRTPKPKKIFQNKQISDSNNWLFYWQTNFFGVSYSLIKVGPKCIYNAEHVCLLEKRRDWFPIKI